MADNKEEILGLDEKRAGAAPEEASQRSSSAHNRHSLPKDVKRRSLYDEDSLDGDNSYDLQGRESVGSGKDTDRVKLVRDRQNEERQRKLEELRQQALAAQRFREQREEERRKRIDELRSRDNDRRNQVEERKRLIWEADRERREAILRKNQEREARIEAKKKNERSHIVFAFGSSTPRMLEPADTGGSTFWGTRRATSTTNVMMFTAAQPLTRRSSERELDGSKKRATSAGGLDRKPGEDMRISSSMYEVFNWNASSDNHNQHQYQNHHHNHHQHPSTLIPAKSKRASLSLPPTYNDFVFDIERKPASLQARDSRPGTVVNQRAASGEESDGGPGTPSSSAYLRVNRRRTDLMPTIPSPRDAVQPSSTGRSSSAKAFTRSPGRTYSMSRLDQLSQPRKRPTSELSTLAEQQSIQPLGASSMSRSMSHLAPAGTKSLKRSDNSRSMGTLPGAVPNSSARPTRAERLRRRARDQHYHQQQQGIRSGEVTPSSPSRPHSSLSQQSGSSVGSSNVSLRPRTTTPRRPRPASIAGTGVTVTERHNFIGDLKVTKDSKPPLPKVHSTPKKPSSTQKLYSDNGTASIQASTTTATTTTTAATTITTTTTTTGTGTGTGTATPNVKRVSVDKLIKSTKASPRITPKATPLQSPGNDNPPIIQTNLNTVNVKQDDYRDVKGFDDDEKLDHGTEKTEAQRKESALSDNKKTVDEVTINVATTDSQSEKIGVQLVSEPVLLQQSKDKENLKEKEEEKESIMAKDLATVLPTAPQYQQQQQQQQQQETNVNFIQQQTPASNKSYSDKKDEKKVDKKSPEPEIKQDSGDNDEHVDMTASMIAKTRITTEEEAKAALAERRRLAREQAEREAELERQRIEEEARLEMERQRAEEEEQRRLEEESLRLASEARQAEEQRLRLAIEEAQRREEEDRKRREEEARQKQEKEEAEKKAREEAEKQRIEMAERLKKEEEERIARRKRVEAIMLRTRGKNQPNTPTKGDGGDGDKLKDDNSPGDETAKCLSVEKVGVDVMTASLISEATENFIASEQQANNIESNSIIVEPTSLLASSSKILKATKTEKERGETEEVKSEGGAKLTTSASSNPNEIQTTTATTTSSISTNNGSQDINLLRNGTQQRSNGAVKNGSDNTSGNGDILLIDDKSTSGNNQQDNEINCHNNQSNHANRGNGVNSIIINEPITLDNATVKQNNVTNNLLDFSSAEYDDNMSNESSGVGVGVGQTTIIDLSQKLVNNEDTINSNLNPSAMTFNPLANPFSPAATTMNVNDNTNPFLQDNNFGNNKSQQQDKNQVKDLLS